jgi:hypothetical protein
MAVSQDRKTHQKNDSGKFISKMHQGNATQNCIKKAHQETASGKTQQENESAHVQRLLKRCRCEEIVRCMEPLKRTNTQVCEGGGGGRAQHGAH